MAEKVEAARQRATAERSVGRRQSLGPGGAGGAGAGGGDVLDVLSKRPPESRRRRRRPWASRTRTPAAAPATTIAVVTVGTSGRPQSNAERARWRLGRVAGLAGARAALEAPRGAPRHNPLAPTSPPRPRPPMRRRERRHGRRRKRRQRPQARAARSSSSSSLSSSSSSSSESCTSSSRYPAVLLRCRGRPARCPPQRRGRAAAGSRRFRLVHTPQVPQTPLSRGSDDDDVGD